MDLLSLKHFTETLPDGPTVTETLPGGPTVTETLPDGPAVIETLMDGSGGPPESPESSPRHLRRSGRSRRPPDRYGR